MMDLFDSCSEEEVRKRLIKTIPEHMIDLWITEADIEFGSSIKKWSLEEFRKEARWVSKIPPSLINVKAGLDGEFSAEELMEFLVGWVERENKTRNRFSYVTKKLERLRKIEENERIGDLHEPF